MATQTKMERAGNIPMQEISRTQKLRKKILKAPYEICIERARYYTQIFKETEGQHPSLRAAKALERTLDNMTTYILPEEMIVGNRSSKLVATVIPIERGDVNLFMGSDLGKLQKRKDHPFKIGAAEKKELQKEILPYWKDKTLRYKRMEETVDANLFNLLSFSPGSIISRLRNFGIFGLIKTLKPLVIGRISRIFYWLKQAALNNPDLVNNIFDVQGHLILGINKVIEVGFKGIKEKALESKKNYEEGSEQSLFLDSVIISCEAVKRFAQKFSDLANQMAEEETNSKRKEELLQIAKNLKKVPWEPPTSFHEAIQFAWFTLDVALISQGVAGIIAIGRPDQ
ncbi:MAG: hypothetical protein GY870_00440, partial [archaeon]|nr:hypothetical protein [archaeon]